MNINEALEWADIWKNLDEFEETTTERFVVNILASEVRRLQEDNQLRMMQALENGQRAEAAEAIVTQLGRESYAAVQGWYPEDFAEIEGPFTIDSAVMAIKTELQMGREAHNKLQVVEMAARRVLADHDERMDMYPDKNNQPHRVKVMKQLRTALDAGEEEEQGDCSDGDAWTKLRDRAEAAEAKCFAMDAVISRCQLALVQLEGLYGCTAITERARRAISALDAGEVNNG